VVEDAGEFEAGDGGDLVVVAAGEAVGGGASEEGADLAGSEGDAVGELLVGEGAGAAVGGGGWGVKGQMRGSLRFGGKCAAFGRDDSIFSD
jgi:hypothetical protein